MPLVDLQAPPSEATRRWFGLSLCIVLLFLALLLGNLGDALTIVLLVAAGLVLAAYYGRPGWQLPIIRGWQIMTFPIAWIVGQFLLSLIFFGVVLPIGLLLRLFRYDPLRLRKTGQTNHWQDRPPAPTSDRYFQQF